MRTAGTHFHLCLSLSPLLTSHSWGRMLRLLLYLHLPHLVHRHFGPVLNGKRGEETLGNAVPDTTEVTGQLPGTDLTDKRAR